MSHGVEPRHIRRTKINPPEANRHEKSLLVSSSSPRRLSVLHLIGIRVGNQSVVVVREKRALIELMRVSPN
jgi:hypothetical protein